jgi:hypothetical protein
MPSAACRATPGRRGGGKNARAPKASWAPLLGLRATLLIGLFPVLPAGALVRGTSRAKTVRRRRAVSRIWWRLWRAGLPVIAISRGERPPPTPPRGHGQAAASRQSRSPCIVAFRNELSRLDGALRGRSAALGLRRRAAQWPRERCDVQHHHGARSQRLLEHASRSFFVPPSNTTAEELTLGCSLWQAYQRW